MRKWARVTIDGAEHAAIGDAELLLAVRGGDQACYAELYDRHAAAALVVARQYTDSVQDAEDVVADAFTAVWSALLRGSGPQEAFRAYLFTVVRRVAAVRRDQGRRTEPTDDVATLEAGSVPMAGADDPAIEGFERSVVARAFRTLPERWQVVLWHSEVEGLSPAQIAPLLGLSANSTAALAYRAREGLRQAYLAEHLAAPLDEGCRNVAGRLGGYVRGGLGPRETRQVAEHLDGCVRCTALVAELGDVNHGMRAVVAPVVLGSLAAAVLAKGLAVGGGLVALPWAAGAGAGALGGVTGSGAAGGSSGAAGTGGVASGSGAAAGGAGASSAAAGAGAAIGAPALAGAAAGGGAAGAAAATGGVLAGLAALPAAAIAGIAVAVVAVAASVAVVVQLATGGPPAAGPAPSDEGSSHQTVSQAPSAAASPQASAVQPSDSPTAVAPTVAPYDGAPTTPGQSSRLLAAPAPARVVVTVPDGGLTLVAGEDDQALVVGFTNLGDQPATNLAVDVTLPPGVSVAGLVEGNLIASGGTAVPAASTSWVCVRGSGDVAARCVVEVLAGGASTQLVLHVSVAESYDAADGNIGLRVAGDSIEASAPSVRVAFRPAPARIALRGSVPALALVTGRSRPLTLVVANEGAVATTAAAPARVQVTLPDGVRSTTTTSGPWTCAPGGGTVVCTGVLAGRTVSTLALDLAADPGVAVRSGAVGIAVGPTHHAGAARVAYSVLDPARLTTEVPAELGPLALGSTRDAPVQVANVGELASQQVTVRLSRPEGAAWAGAASGDGWGCRIVGPLQLCTHDGMDPAGSSGLVVHLTGVAGRFGAVGDLSATATADDADEGEPVVVALRATAPVVTVGTSGGRLLLTDGKVGTVTFSVDVAAGADASGVVVTVTLPPGISYAPDFAAQTPGCAQGSSAQEVVCDLGQLGAGTSTRLLVAAQAAGAATGSTGIVVAADGNVSASASVPVVSSSGGLVPEVSFSGDVHVTQVGAPLLTCTPSTSCTSAVERGTADNNGQTMVPLDQRPPTGERPATRAVSATTTLAVPEGEQVVWAGLYWSANAAVGDDWSTTRTAARIAGPGGGYEAVDGVVVADQKDSSGRSYYQSFADVTALVRAGGPGAWSVADTAVATPGVQTGASSNYYAGWSLVVVYGTVGTGSSSARTVTVYDGGTWVDTRTTTPAFEFATRAGSQATIGVVAWEGDRRVTGDQLLLNGTALTPRSWDGSSGSASNAFDSTATGWGLMNSLGVDVKAFRPQTLASDVGSLTPTTSGDLYLIGVVTVEAAAPQNP